MGIFLLFVFIFSSIIGLFIQFLIKRFYAPVEKNPQIKKRLSKKIIIIIIVVVLIFFAIGLDSLIINNII